MQFKSFTRRYVDKSNTTGFQFEFWCDLCTSSHMTSFQYDPMGVAASLVTAAGWLVRGGNKYGEASQQLNQLLRGKSWDDAYAKAVDEAQKLFTHCSRCRRWVCADHCWAKEAMLCRGCVPDLAAESVAMKAQAGRIQLFGNALASDQTGGRDLSAPQLMRCLHCNRSNVGGNFCADCGKPMIAEIACRGCEASWAVHLNYQYCPSCGANMSKATMRETAPPPAQEELMQTVSAETEAQAAQAEQPAELPGEKGSQGGAGETAKTVEAAKTVGAATTKPAPKSKPKGGRKNSGKSAGKKPAPPSTPRNSGNAANKLGKAGLGKRKSKP